MSARAMRENFPVGGGESEVRSFWEQKDQDRKAKFPDGNYPPLDRWDLDLTIKKALNKRRKAKTN